MDIRIAYFPTKDCKVFQRRCFPKQSWTSSGETAKRSIFQQDGIANATDVKLLAPRRIKQDCPAHRTAACAMVQLTCALFTVAQSREALEGTCFPSHRAEQAPTELG